MPDRQLTIRATAMPTDLNPYGGVFGGWLMAQMALGAGSLARAVGDELSVYAQVIATGRTSLTILAQGVGRARNGEDETKVSEGTFKFVLLDDNDKPRAIAVSHA